MILQAAACAQFRGGEKRSHVIGFDSMFRSGQQFQCEQFARACVGKSRKPEFVHGARRVEHRDKLLGSHISAGPQTACGGRSRFPFRWRSGGKVAIGLYIYFCLYVGYAKFRGMIGESQKPEPFQSVVHMLETSLQSCATSQGFKFG
ncbi:hypothetical protein ACM41_06280 [Bradyrhizobium sp. CCBAU 21362]|nr:hypothetical protein [Bradyrhizobium sp. CCBAU 21362]